YYSSRCARRDFISFLEERAGGFPDARLEAMLQFERALVAAEETDEQIARTGEVVTGATEETDIPVRVPDVHVLEASCDLQGVIDALRTGQHGAPASATRHYRTSRDSEAAFRIVEISDLAADAIRSCDGSITVGEFLDQASGYFDCPEATARRAARYLLDDLRDRRIIAAYRPAESSLACGMIG